MSLVLRLTGLQQDVDDPYLFRQAHVASQIQSITESSSLAPPIFVLNNPRLVFDLPLYQYLTASLATVGGLDPVFTGRLFCLLLGLFVLVLFVRLARSTNTLLLAVVLLATSPLLIDTGRALLPDNLALVLALLWFERDSNRAGHYHWGWAILSAVIKPTFIFGFWLARLYECRRAQAPKGRSVSYRRLFIHLVIFTSAACTVRLYSIWLLPTNGDASLDFVWFFGAISDRLDPTYYGSVIETMLTRYTVWPFILLFAAEFYHRRRLSFRSLPNYQARGLLYGQAVLVVLFLPLYVHHDYYHLSVVLALAIILAQMDWQLPVKWLYFAVVAACLVSPFEKRTPSEHVVWQKAGQAIQKATHKDDVIIYAGIGNWHPAPLYFAQRRGYNLGRRSFNRATLGVFRKKQPDARIYVYLPERLELKLQYHVKELPVTKLRVGSLYKLQEP